MKIKVMGENIPAVIQGKKVKILIQKRRTRENFFRKAADKNIRKKYTKKKM